MELVIPTDDQRKKWLEDVRELLAQNKRLLIWGKGEYSNIIQDYLRENGILQKPQYLIDDAFFKEGSPDTIRFSHYIEKGDCDDVIIFGFYNYSAVLKKRAEWGKRLPFLFDFHFAVVQGQRLKWDASVARIRQEDYRETYAMLADERSRITMQRYLDAAIAGKFDELYQECHISRDYFNEITENTKPDTLIDCGAFDGDSIHDFVEMFPKYRKLIAFEPDPDNVTKIRTREKSEHLHDLLVIDKGVYSENTMLRFCANGESNSFLSGTGEVAVEVCRLDDFREKIVGNAFLKMDIEGSELDALKGAENLIREQHPILAICVYHKENDLIDIPRFICKTVGEGVYRYYIGFHGLDLAELCFYAIPTEVENAAET